MMCRSTPTTRSGNGYHQREDQHTWKLILSYLFIMKRYTWYGTNYLHLKIHTIKKATLVLWHCEVHIRLWLCAGLRKQTTRTGRWRTRAQLFDFTQTVGIVTALLFLARVGLPRWRTNLPSPCLLVRFNTFTFGLYVFQNFQTFFLKPSGTTCSFRRNSDSWLNPLFE